MSDADWDYLESANVFQLQHPLNLLLFDCPHDRNWPSAMTSPEWGRFITTSQRRGIHAGAAPPSLRRPNASIRDFTLLCARLIGETDLTIPSRAPIAPVGAPANPSLHDML
jgi:hypothetical protein